MADTGEWDRHTIPEIGLSFAVNRAWPLDTLDLPGGRMIYQRLPGEAGSFFVRYGPAQTVDAVVAALGGSVAITDDAPGTLAGVTARRVEVTITARGGGSFSDEAPSRDRSPLVVTRLVFVGLSLDGIPLVTGYLLATEERATSEPVLERMLDSVQLDGAQPQD